MGKCIWVRTKSVWTVRIPLEVERMIFSSPTLGWLSLPNKRWTANLSSRYQLWATNFEHLTIRKGFDPPRTMTVVRMDEFVIFQNVRDTIAVIVCIIIRESTKNLLAVEYFKGSQRWLCWGEGQSFFPGYNFIKGFLWRKMSCYCFPPRNTSAIWIQRLLPPPESLNCL